MSLGERDSYEALARDIRAIVEVQNWTLGTLSAEVHFAPSTLSEALRAKSRISVELARALTRVLNVDHPRWIERARSLKAEPFIRDFGAKADRGAAVSDDGRGAARKQVGNVPRPGVVVTGDNNVVHMAPTWAPPPPDPSAAFRPEEFNLNLRLLLGWAGNPPLRKLEEISRGELKRATVSDMLRRADHLPKRDLVQSFVTACGAASEWPRWNMAWQSVNATMHSSLR
jgi:hypothetical protein